ncbi:MAG: hypothetical protein HY746_08295 [Elusimicrobia bacterium]|nr:hypothetical protein [Elusimicrobiota bacterium]
MKTRKGIAMSMVAIMMVFLVPLLIYLLVTTTTYLTHSRMEKQLKMAGSLASNAIIDFMRQFSQNYYEGHYDADSLERDKSFYSVGFSDVTTEPDSQNHRLFIHAKGEYGQNPSNPLADKNLYSVIQFISDLTDYGTLINGAFTISASNVTYYGKWWITGNLSISGANVRFVGGPLIVGGNLSVTGTNCQIEGDLYYGGSLTGSPTVTGATYNFYPSDMVYPTINENFYKINYNYKLTTDRTLQFEAYPSSSAFKIISATITVPILDTGMIVLGENCNLTIYGTVKGRVSVVTTNTSPTKGKITIGLSNQEANLFYYDSLTGGTTTSAIYGNSIAAIASNGITFQGKTTTPTRDLTVCGVFFNRSTANMTASGGAGRRFNLYGTRNKPISTSFTGGSSFTYDIWLNKYPPPSLPERPVLVTMHLR